MELINFYEDRIASLKSNILKTLVGSYIDSNLHISRIQLFEVLATLPKKEFLNIFLFSNHLAWHDLSMRYENIFTRQNDPIEYLDSVLKFCLACGSAYPLKVLEYYGFYDEKKLKKHDYWYGFDPHVCHIIRKIGSPENAINFVRDPIPFYASTLATKERSFSTTLISRNEIYDMNYDKAKPTIILGLLIKNMKSNIKNHITFQEGLFQKISGSNSRHSIFHPIYKKPMIELATEIDQWQKNKELEYDFRNKLIKSLNMKTWIDYIEEDKEPG